MSDHIVDVTVTYSYRRLTPERRAQTGQRYIDCVRGTFSAVCSCGWVAAPGLAEEVDGALMAHIRDLTRIVDAAMAKSK